MADISDISPKYSRTKIDAAGKRLVKSHRLSDADFEEIIPIIENWRISHLFPLIYYRNAVKDVSPSVDDGALVVYRLKRLFSIVRKLIAESTRLTQMQDIGGLRVVVSSLEQAHQMSGAIKNHFMIADDIDHIDDYISKPRASGYRGLHVIVKFPPGDGDEKPFDGMKIEIQVRTLVQHAWATAVETVGTFTRQALKSSAGGTDYLRFFALMGSAMAEKEGTAAVPYTPDSGSDLISEIRCLEKSLKFRQRFAAFGAALQESVEFPPDAEYYLLDLDPTSMNVSVRGYTSKQLEEANSDYVMAEGSLEGSDDPRQVVLVSANSISSLKQAYPNYFLNSDAFKTALDELLQS